MDLLGLLNTFKTLDAFLYILPKILEGC